VVEILEQGTIAFLAEGRRGVPEPADPADLARFFLVLAPPGRAPLRRLSIRRRRLPARERGQRFYAHVDRIGPRVRVAEDLRAGPGDARRARVLAAGRYALARHGDHVHLAYALARSCRAGPLARGAGVAAGGHFVLYVFRRSLPPTRRPEQLEPLAPATPARLDVIGVEVALVAGGRRRDPALGIARIRRDRVGEALVGALLRRGGRPQVASSHREREAAAVTRG
jgi:hypothetical protein